MAKLIDIDPTPSSPAAIWQILSQTVSLASVWVMAGLLGWHSLTDLDIWFHLRMGKDLLAGMPWPHLNTYSFAFADYPWLNHEWLFQIAAAWTGPTTGGDSSSVLGWNLLRIGLILAIYGYILLGDGVYQELRRGRSSYRPAMISLVALFSLLLVWTRFNLRPELISYLCLVLIVRQSEAHFSRPAMDAWWRDRSLWILFSTVTIWAQFHGFAAMGPLVVLVAAVTVPRENKQRWSPLALSIPIALCFAALALTPNGWHGLLFPLRALSQLNSEVVDLSTTISELVPLLATKNSLHLTLMAFKVSVVWAFLVAVLGWRQISLLRIALCGATAFAAYSNQRNIALYGLAFVLLHSGHKGLWPSLWWRTRLRWMSAKSVAGQKASCFTVVLVIGAAALWAPSIWNDDFYLSEGVGRRFGDGVTPSLYPDQAAKSLSQPSENFTFGNLGAAAYLLGNTTARVWIDGRTEAYPPQHWADYVLLRGGGQPALSILDREKIQAVVLAIGSGSFKRLAADLFESDSWSVVAADGGGVHYRRGLDTSRLKQVSILASAANKLKQDHSLNPTRRADNLVAASMLYEMASMPVESNQILKAGLQLRPDHPTLNHNFGTSLLAAGNYNLAKSHFEKAFHENPRLAGSALNVGVCLMHLGYPEAASTFFAKSLEVDASNIGAWLNLAVARKQMGKTEAAIAALEKAVALQPKNTRLQGQLNQWRREFKPKAN